MLHLRVSTWGPVLHHQKLQGRAFRLQGLQRQGLSPGFAPPEAHAAVVTETHQATLNIVHACQVPATARTSDNPDPATQLSAGDLQTWTGAYFSKVLSSAFNVVGESLLALRGSLILPFLGYRCLRCLGCSCRYHRSSVRL